MFLEGKKAGEFLPFDVELKSKNGKCILAEINIRKLEEGEGFSSELAIAKDITHRKTMEEAVLNATSTFIKSVRITGINQF